VSLYVIDGAISVDGARGGSRADRAELHPEVPTRLVNRITPPDHTLAAYCDQRRTGILPLVAVSYSEARRFVGRDELCGIGVINPCWVRRLRLRLVCPCSGNQFTSVSSIRAFALCTVKSLAERPSSGSPWP
jgi:hypothetical protein